MTGRWLLVVGAALALAPAAGAWDGRATAAPFAVRVFPDPVPQGGIVQVVVNSAGGAGIRGLARRRRN